MSTSQQKAIRKHRQRLRQRGLKRVEVEAAEADASLIRQLAKILRQDDEAAGRIRERLGAILRSKEPGLKALLAEAPLDAIRITRSKEPSRKIEL